jgi:hypothetical protein
MAIARDEKGAALVTALMLTMLSLVVALTLLYTVTLGTRISAGQKRYRSALAAAHGGVELVTQEILPLLLSQAPLTATGLEGSFSLVGLKVPAYPCLQQKMGSATSSWSACSAAQASPDPAEQPDLTFTLGGTLPGDPANSGPAYRLYAKIIDTVPGNSDAGSADLLDPGSAVSGREEVIRPQHVPGLYSISVQGAGDSSREKARLSLLYAY